ncbi:MAG: PAS domain-containing protein [Gammaproteobacteria bacterium]|nr:PAS domain-containing protein [Gammaproteobacteria bacterium]
MKQSPKNASLAIQQTRDVTGSAINDINHTQARPLVLVVDDDAAIRLLLRRALQRAGFDVEEAGDGPLALTLFARSRPDIVLLDVMMPEMDGFAVCERLQNASGPGRVPVVFMTGLDDDESITRAYEVGATDFITKPISYLILNHRLRYILRGTQTANELRASEERLGHAQRIAKLGHWEWDAETNKVHFYDVPGEIFGLGGTETVLDLNEYMAIVYPNDRAMVRRAFEKAVHDKENFRLKHRLIGSDGSERIVYQEAESRDCRERGTLVFRGTIQDITERVQTRVALQEAETRFRHLVDSNPSIIYTTRAHGDYACTFISQRLYEVLGYAPHEMIDDKDFWINRLHPDDCSRTPAEFLQQLQDGDGGTLEYRFRHKNGNYLWVHDNHQVIRDGNGACLEIIGSWTDISEHKQIEEEVKQKHRLLAAISKAQSRFIRDADPSEIFDRLLSDALDLTDSDYGFIAEVLYSDAGQPYLKTCAITNIAWNCETRELYAQNALQGLEFHNLDTLFGSVLTTGAPVIANDPSNDARRGGLPSGHRSLDAFLGVPFRRGRKVIGMLCVANRPAGYDQALVDHLTPLVSTCTNIVEAMKNERQRQKTEAALQRSEERYAMAIRGSSDGLWDWNVVTGDVYWSPRLKKMLGYEEHEGSNALGFLVARLHPQDKPVLLEALHRHLQARIPFDVEFRARTKQDEWRWFHVRGQAVWDDEGKATRMAGSFRDVTDRREAMEHLNRFKHVLDNTLDMIFMFNPETLRFVYLSRGAVESMGYSRKELLNMAPCHINPLMSESNFREFIAPLLSGQEKSLSFETTYRRKDRTEFPVEIFLQLVRENKSDQKVFVAIVRDVTERKKIDRMKNEFVSTVSHELRTPLTSIVGSLGLIAGGVSGQLSSQTRNLIDIAYQNSQRLVRLINDILDVEKIESGEMKFDMHPLGVAPLIRQAIEANESYAEQFEVNYALKDGAGDAKALVDSDRAIQVMTNLLSNAVKFSPRGDTVLISIKRMDHVVRVEVKDNGPGIPEQVGGRIFERFAQVDASNTRQKGGTGLGLNIAKSIVKSFGGRIGYQCGKDKGTTFYFELPEWRDAQPLQAETVGGI